ncbi:MAG: hypothetical protein RLZ22_1282 [Verrucomicrobiota bacterium]|jgi:hypothetical protein
MAQIPFVRLQVFFSGAIVVGLGILAMRVLERGEAFGFLQGALTLGGGFLICGLFSLKFRWHGIIGAGVLALLGAARGVGNISHLRDALSGVSNLGSAPLMELGVTLVCLVLLLRVLAALNQERVRRMLEKD